MKKRKFKLKEAYVVKRQKGEEPNRMFDEHVYSFRAKWSAKLFLKWCQRRRPEEQYYVNEFMYS